MWARRGIESESWEVKPTISKQKSCCCDTLDLKDLNIEQWKSVSKGEQGETRDIEGEEYSIDFNWNELPIFF